MDPGLTNGKPPGDPPADERGRRQAEPDRARPLFRVLFGVALAGLGAHALHSGLNVGGGGLDGFFNDWVYNALLVAAAVACVARAALVHAERGAWLLIGLGIAFWTAGDIHWTLALSGLEEPPFPTMGDAMYLGLYPCVYAGLVLLVRARVRHFHASLWLDGAIGALAVGAIGAALIFRAILDSTEGSAAAVATNLAYPLGDLLLLGFVAGLFALTGWRPGRSWQLIGAGLVLSATADALFLYQEASNSYVEGTLLDSLWPAGALLVAYAAWRPAEASARIRLEGWRMLAVPALFALAAVGLLLYDNLSPLNPLAVGLATATLVMVIVRMAMTFGENLRMLAASRLQASTDPLTGLGNRRKLMEDLADRFALPGGGEPMVLILFDLDGFKGYNDAYGHPAGDALLQRLARSLAAATTSFGSAYRLGGDEFCVLAPTGPAKIESIVAATVAALSEQGEGFEITSSYGAVIVPHEAEDAAQGLLIADQRMYAQKESQRASAGRQSRDVLLRALQEQEPELRRHLRGVAELAVLVGRRMKLGPEELDVLGRAAELHDVGKVAIPEAILHKPGPLDEEEWSFIREHTIIGERILGAAPALVPVAKLVRSSHERWDGAGYPDGLAGEEIPLGARIVAVCDAFDAMISVRSYRSAVSVDEALSELCRCAGSQFDPLTVQAFCEVVAAHPEALREDRSTDKARREMALLDRLTEESRAVAAQLRATLERS